jgi:hypothetical protein
MPVPATAELIFATVHAQAHSNQGVKMRNVRDVLKAIGGWIGRVLTAEIFPEDTARVLPVSPIPPTVRLHREGDERRAP